jgi:hypothetical protein
MVLVDTSVWVEEERCRRSVSLCRVRTQEAKRDARLHIEPFCCSSLPVKWIRSKRRFEMSGRHSNIFGSHDIDLASIKV